MAFSFGAFAQFKAAPKVNNMDNFRGIAKAPFYTFWEQMSPNAAWTVNDIDGNSVSLQSYLNDGKFVLLDFSCTWCNPCWNLHNSGILEQIQALSNFQVIWVESESTNTTAQIYGPAGGTTYADATCGDWTVDASGNPVPYPIIDDDANSTCLMPFMDLYYGYVPTLILVAPNGQYCNLDGAFSYQYPTESVQLIQMVAQSYPQAGQEPQCMINGEEAVHTNTEVVFTAYANSYDPVTGYSWKVDGANAGNTEELTYTFTNAGDHIVILTVTNANGSASDTLDITATEIPAGVLSYTYENEYYSGIGTGQASTVYWAVSFPPSMLTGRTSVNSVDCFIAADYPATYTMSVYSGSATAPTTLLGSASQTITSSWEDGYCTFTPSSSIAIDQNQTLWIVMSAAQTYPAAGCESVDNPNSDWISLDGASWDHASDYNLDYSWLIDCYTTNGNNGISRLSNADVAIYPNPANDYVNVRAEGLKEVSVLDLSGRVLSTTDNSKVSISGLAAGIYVVRVVTENGVTMQKIVKE